VRATHVHAPEHAQASRDLGALRAHGRRGARVTLRGQDPAAELQALTDRLQRLL
jgi:hypothetical protein